MTQFKNWLRATLIALVPTLGMLLVHRWVFVQLLGFNGPVMEFIIPVTVAAWFGGVRAGLIATCFSAGVGVYLFVEHMGVSSLPRPFQLRLAMFMVIGAMLSLLLDSLHSTRRRLEERQRGLEQEILERQRAEAALQLQQAQLLREIARREQIEQALCEREERFRMAVESADIGTWDFNPVTGERNWSIRAKEMFGLAPDADVNFTSYLDRFHPDDRQCAQRAVQQALDARGDGRYEIDCRLVWPDGSIHWFIVKGQAFFQGQGADRHAVRFIGTVLDITDRKRSEMALRASESRLQAITSNTPAVIYLKDWQGRYLMINRRFEEIFNTTQQQVAGKIDVEVFPSDVAAMLVANDRQVQQTGRPLEFEEELPQPDGPHTYFSVKFPVYDEAGRPTAVGGISTDISDRKKAMDALAAEQELLRHIIEIQDEERQLVTCEIHDGLVQYAAGALMQLEAARAEIESESARQKIDQVMSILRKTVAEGRRLINGIRTPVLDDWGVVAALENLIDEEDRANVTVEFVKDPELGRMAPNVEEALYRITQEAMTNTYKHSNTTRVRIELVRRGDRVRLEVRDWGTGFTPAARSKRVHGLHGMTTRARIAGGHCTILSTPGEGTQVVAELPYLGRT